MISKELSHELYEVIHRELLEMEKTAPMLAGVLTLFTKNIHSEVVRVLEKANSDNGQR